MAKRMQVDVTYQGMMLPGHEHVSDRGHGGDGTKTEIRSQYGPRVPDFDVGDLSGNTGSYAHLRRSRSVEQRHF